VRLKKEKLKMASLIDDMTEEQLEILLKFRKQTQLSTAKFIEDLAEAKHTNASLVALSEVSATVGDVIYITSLFGNNPLNLMLNNCENIEQFREKLYLFAINHMVLIVKQYLELKKEHDSKVSEEDLIAAKSAIKH
jgi:hypothetical protein